MWWMWFGIIIGFFVLIGILGAIGMKLQKRFDEQKVIRDKQEKIKQQELILLSAQDVLNVEQCESYAEYKRELSNKNDEIGDYARKEYNICKDKLYELEKELDEINEEADKILSDLNKYYFGKSVDSDFEELLTVYRRKKNIADKEYLVALQKCREKKYPTTKRLYALEDKRENFFKGKEMLENDLREWNNVYLQQDQEKWNNLQCEKFYKMRRNLWNKIIEIEAKLEKDPVYKEHKEKSKKWEKYLVGCIIVSSDSKYLFFGRNGETVAIWNMDDYQGQEMSIEDVAYFHIDTQTQTRTQTLTSVSSINSASKLGTAIDEAIWGTAAATASAMQKNQQSSSTVSHSQTEIRKTATIFFNYETNLKPLKVSDSNVDNLIAMMPEKQK